MQLLFMKVEVTHCVRSPFLMITGHCFHSRPYLGRLKVVGKEDVMDFVAVCLFVWILH